MKQRFPLFLLFLGALVLAGCGAVPKNPSADARLGFPNAPAGAPAANTPSAAPNANASAAPAPEAAPAQSSALPSPPSHAVVYDQVQSTTDDWDSCSQCAMGTNVTTNYWTAPHQSSPSLSGSSREFYIGGKPWSNALFWKTYRENTDKTHFLWEFSVYFDPTTMDNIWTAEYDLWQSIGGKEFMIGTQCNFGDGYWDLFDSKANKWLHSDIPCKRLEPNKWHRIQWYMERLGREKYRYNTLVVDGKAYQINRSFEPNPINWADTMGIQWQLDQSSTGVDLHEWVDNVKLTVW